MVKLSFIHALALSLPLIVALPNALELENRGACASSPCHLDLFVVGLGLGRAKVQSDCSSYLLNTVTLCPSTMYTTVTATVTAVARSVTTTTVQTTMPIITSVIQTTVIVTGHNTFTTSTTSVVTSTVDQSSTQVITTTKIVFERDSASYSRPQLGVPAGASKRAVPTTCKPVTKLASAIPKYASGFCNGFGQYSSACSCEEGVQGKTSTVQSTTTSTVIVTQTIKPTSTFTTVSTATLPITTTTTTSVLSTLQTTDSTQVIVITSTTDVSSTAITTTTSTVTSTSICSSFIAQATSGAFAGQYLNYQNENTALSFDASISDATIFVNNGGQFAPASDTTAILSTFNDNVDLVYASTNPVADGLIIITCTFASPSISGPFTCSSSNSNTPFLTCPNEASAAGAPASSLIISNGAIAGSDCMFLSLVAIEACG